MSVAARQEALVLTYEEYLAEAEAMARYDILDGVRIPMNPTRRHQRVLRNIARALEAYESHSQSGQAIVAPCDVLIHKSPLRTRQPDVLFISNERLAENPPETDAAPLEVAPELVVEILSPHETRRKRMEKMTDYQPVGVQECWIVSTDTQRVEVFRLSWDAAELSEACGLGETVHAGCFPGLSILVDDFFTA
ncbi:MAG: Uma2 family endonuclease [Actinomycetota bacterium]